MNFKLICASIVGLGIGMAIAAPTPAFQLKPGEATRFDSARNILAPTGKDALLIAGLLALPACSKLGRRLRTA